MIGPGTGVRVYLACGITDMRKGIGGLAMLAQDVLRQKATGGAVFAFRGRRGDRLKLGWTRLLPLLQGSRTGTLSMALGARRDSASDLGAVGHAVGRHRLAQARLGCAAGACRIDLSH